MSEIETGGPAFPADPFIASNPENASVAKRIAEGMTLRDYFAAKVVPEVYASAIKTAECTGGEIYFRENWRLDLACEAFKMADAMLEARK
jgi:hypothetical protein